MAANKGEKKFEQIKGKKRINKQMKTAVDNHTLLHTEEVKRSHWDGREWDGECVWESERDSDMNCIIPVCVWPQLHTDDVCGPPRPVYRSLISVVTAITFCLISSIFFISFLLLLVICMAHLRKFLFFFSLACLEVANDFCLCRF